MDQIRPEFKNFDKPMLSSNENDATQSKSPQSISSESLAEVKARIAIKKGATSGLGDRTSKMSSQERLVMQARIFGKSAIVSIAAINIALFTPIEFSFGKMTSLTLSSMLFCLNKIEEEDKKLRLMRDKNSSKKQTLKRMESMAKKIGAYVGFSAMTVLMGGFGSIAMGTAFTIQQSLSLQEE